MLLEGIGISHEVATARTRTVCTECGERFLDGQVMVRIAYCYAGECPTMKLHVLCASKLEVAITRELKLIMDRGI